MADRTSAGIFGSIFKLLAENPTDENKRLAREIYGMTLNYDFFVSQMDCNESLIKLGLDGK